MRLMTADREKILIHLSDFVCYTFSMGYRTIEADKDGRVVVYPSLYGPRDGGRGVCRILSGLFKRLFSFPGK